jgi:hypothetical protein
MALKAKFKFGNQLGSTMIEMTVALPLFFSMLFIFQDVFVVSYNWVLMQNIVHEGVREGILGPYDDVANSHLRRAEEKMNSLATGLGIINNEDFQIKNSDLYKTVGGFTIRACGLPQQNNGLGFQSRQSPFGELIVTTMTKRIYLTPISEMLISLAGQDGAIEISTESQGFVEPAASESANLTDICSCAFNAKRGDKCL